MNTLDISDDDRKDVCCNVTNGPEEVSDEKSLANDEVDASIPLHDGDTLRQDKESRTLYAFTFLREIGRSKTMKTRGNAG